MTKQDYNYLKSEIIKAEQNKLFYNKLGLNYKKDEIFWTGYLNAVNLMWIQAKNKYKL